MNALLRSPLCLLVTLIFLVVVLPAAEGQSLGTSNVLSPQGTSAEMMFFDVEAIQNILITDFDSVALTYLGFPIPHDYEVWATKDGGSYVGREGIPSEWELIGTVDGVPSAGLGAWTPLGLNLNLLVPAGEKRGFAFARPAFNVIPIVDLGIPGTVVASNADLMIRSGTKGDYFSDGPFPGTPGVKVHYTAPGPFAVDIAPYRIISPNPDPLGCAQLSGNEQFVVEVINLATAPLPPGTIFPLSLSIDGGPAVTEFVLLSQGLLPGGKLTYTFSMTFDLAAIGSHNIVVTSNFATDENTSNDVLTGSLNSGGELRVSSFPFIEDFESLNRINLIVPPAGWTQEINDSMGKGSEWYFPNQDVFRPTLPQFDRTTGDGQWASLIDLDSQQPVVSLRSPCFDFANLVSPRMSFWLHSRSFSSTVNLLSIDVLDVQTGVLDLDVFGPMGPNPTSGWMGEAVVNDWYRHDVDLSAYSGRVVRVIFRGMTDHGASFGTTGHNTNLDDIWVYDFLPPSGQGAQPGFASFKIGETRNGNFELLDSGVAGPFFATVKANENMVMRFFGEPNMPIFLLGGALNVGAATFPPIGQLDIGGAPDPMTGIPAGITILADGDLTTGINSYFNTGPIGESQFGVLVPNFPPGVVATLQCVMRTSGLNGSFIAISNAIELAID